MSETRETAAIANEVLAAGSKPEFIQPYWEGWCDAATVIRNRILAAISPAPPPASSEAPSEEAINAAVWALRGVPLDSRNGMELQDAISQTGKFLISREDWRRIAVSALRAAPAPPAGPDGQYVTRETLAEAMWYVDCDKSGISRAKLDWAGIYPDSREWALRQADAVLAALRAVPSAPRTTEQELDRRWSGWHPMCGFQQPGSTWVCSKRRGHSGPHSEPLPTNTASAPRTGEPTDADLYWDSENIETSASDLDELAEMNDWRVLDHPRRVQRAVNLPDVWAVLFPDPVDSDCAIVRTFATEAECATAIAAVPSVSAADREGEPSAARMRHLVDNVRESLNAGRASQEEPRPQEEGHA